MSVLLLMASIAALVWLFSAVFRRATDRRTAMRFGTAGAFLFTGVDHFLSSETRYLPMMPEFFGDLRLPLIWFTGVAEIAGALALLLPLRVDEALKLPNLRRWAGLSLSVMLGFLVIANVHVALQGGGVEGLAFGAWYFWLRPLLQPLIILWVLYAAGVIGQTPSSPPKVSHGPSWWSLRKAGALSSHQ
jgi:uncharacterized membrane protein